MVFLIYHAQSVIQIENGETRCTVVRALEFQNWI